MGGGETHRFDPLGAADFGGIALALSHVGGGVMPDVIAPRRDAHAIDLGEATARLSERGFDPNSAENLD